MNNIPILFQGGSYGTYLSWVIDTLFTDIEVVTPFRNIGSSHNHAAPALRFDSWAANPQTYDNLTVHTHPKSRADHSIVDNINTLTRFYKRSILLYPSKSTYLLHCNNYCYKIWHNIWDSILLRDQTEKIYSHWNVDKSVQLSDVPKWIIRDWVSNIFFDLMDNDLEWYLPDHFSNPNCLLIFIDELLYDFESTVQRIQTFFDITPTKEFKEISWTHQINLLLQRNRKQDVLAQTIVESINLNQLTAWDGTKLTLVTEAWIQKYFRDQGYKFSCENLNSFPTSTEELLRCLKK